MCIDFRVKKMMVVEIVLVISDEIVQSALCFYQYNLPQNDYNIQKSYTF